MHWIKRAVYGSVMGAIKVYQRLFLDLRVWGREHIPAGPKIYVGNHISAFDGPWVFPILPEPVCVVVGPPYKSKTFGWFWDAMDQINAMPEHRKTVVDEGVKRLEAGRSVFILPEGDFFPQFEGGRFYPGFARMYLRARVPIVPIAMVAPNRGMRAIPWINIVVEERVYRTVIVFRGPFLVNIGEPMMPDCPDHLSEKEQAEEVVRQVRDRIAALVDDVRVTKFWLC